MICNPTKTGWELIFQRAHALLAAKLVTHWREEDRPHRWTETLTAVTQHDNGWQEWERGVHLTPKGTPLSFLNTPVEEIVRQAERVVARARHQSQWVALLVLMHQIALHTGKRGQDKRLDALLDEFDALQKHWRKLLGLKKAEAEDLYSLLRWGDTFSLILCMHEVPQDGRNIEIGRGPGRKPPNFLSQREDGSLKVDPWPYAVDEFVVSVDTYNVEQLTFRSEHELARMLNTDPTSREWTLRR